MVNQDAMMRPAAPAPFSLKKEERSSNTASVEPPRRMFKAKFTLKNVKKAASFKEGMTMKPKEFNVSRSVPGVSFKENSFSESKKPTSWDLPQGCCALKPVGTQHDDQKGAWNGWPKKGPCQSENKPRCLTVFKPFSLTEERIKETPEVEPSSGVFKSRPMPDFSVPFIPKPSNSRATKPSEFSLYSDLRASERQEFDFRLQQKRQEQEEAEARQRQHQADLEAAELQSYRLSLDFKARPLPRQTGFELKYSTAALTVPSSPNLKTTQRAERRLKAQDERSVFMELD
jgi:hypothetical protein